MIFRGDHAEGLQFGANRLINLTARGVIGRNDDGVLRAGSIAPRNGRDALLRIGNLGDASLLFQQHHNGILIQGRGSAANSVVCYALEITIVDSVGLDLLFERFLSEERGEWPDIDLDLPSKTDRERAIQYVYQRYGELGAAMTANVITFRSRSASREVPQRLRLRRFADQWC
jgi:hypothetical protein